MHKVISLLDNTVSSRNPKTNPPQSLMDRTADTFEELDIQLYHVTCYKAKLYEIFDKLASLTLQSEHVTNQSRVWCGIILCQCMTS